LQYVEASILPPFEALNPVILLSIVGQFSAESIPSRIFAMHLGVLKAVYMLTKKTAYGSLKGFRTIAGLVHGLIQQTY